MITSRRTFHAVFRGATDLSENNFSFKWTEDDKTEFDWKPSNSELCRQAGLSPPTIDVHDASTMADQTVGGVQDIMNTYTKADLLNDLERY